MGATRYLKAKNEFDESIVFPSAVSKLNTTMNDFNKTLSSDRSKYVDSGMRHKTMGKREWKSIV